MDTETARRRYAEDGYVIFRGVLDPDLLAEANRHVDWLLTRHPDLRPEELGHDLARTDPFWIRLVSDPRLVDIGEIFLGPDIALFATHYICKPPFSGRRVGWHQDGAFWPLDPMEAVTLWVAITGSTPVNGCLRVVPGSHRTELSGMRESAGDNVLSAEMAVEVDESSAVDLVLAPGDVSVHDPAIHHGSEPNTSDRWRRGLTIRYIATSTRITDPAAASPFLLRGSAPDGRNLLLALPPYDPATHMAFRGAESWPAHR